MRLIDVQAIAAAELGMSLQIAHADTAAQSLSMAERRQLAAFRFGQRRHDWLIGRNALKQVLRRQGRSVDSAAICHADAGLSLTHGDGHAFAVAASRPGIGIDFERPRTVHPRMASWFLSDEEQAMLPEQRNTTFDRELVRLWTIKEAAFKCHPDNAGLMLADFRIEKRGQTPFNSVRSVRGVHIRVVTAEHRGGFLSVAGVQS